LGSIVDFGRQVSDNMWTHVPSGLATDDLPEDSNARAYNNKVMCSTAHMS